VYPNLDRTAIDSSDKDQIEIELCKVRVPSNIIQILRDLWRLNVAWDREAWWQFVSDQGMNLFYGHSIMFQCGVGYGSPLP
jgi:hypothetical protein